MNANDIKKCLNYNVSSKFGYLNNVKTGETVRKLA